MLPGPAKLIKNDSDRTAFKTQMQKAEQHIRSDQPHLVKAADYLHHLASRTSLPAPLPFESTSRARFVRDDVLPVFQHQDDRPPPHLMVVKFKKRRPQEQR
jgi:hypothetical protein